MFAHRSLSHQRDWIRGSIMNHIDDLRAAAADDSRFTAVAYEIAFGDRRVRIAELREIAATLIGTEPKTRDRCGLLREIQKHQAQG
jgi:hypothetical protein